MKKNVVKLNENTIRKIVTESVKMVLREMQENIDNVAKKVFNTIDFSQEYLEDVDTESLDWEPTGDGWYEAVSPAEFEKDGWKFETFVSWSFKSGWGGSDPEWDFCDKDPKIEYQSPEGQTGSFVL